MMIDSHIVTKNSTDNIIELLINTGAFQNLIINPGALRVNFSDWLVAMPGIMHNTVIADRI